MSDIEVIVIDADGITAIDSEGAAINSTGANVPSYATSTPTIGNTKMALDGTEDTTETVVDPTPLGAPATQAEMDAEHAVNVVSPAAMDAGAVTAPDDVALTVPAVTNKMSAPGVVREPVSYTPMTTLDEISNDSLNKGTETLKTSVNEKLEALATAVSTSFGKVNTDMGLQVTEINTQLGTFKDSVNNAFAALKLAEVAQNDGITGQVNRIAGTLLQSIKSVAEGVADAQSKIAALDDVYGSSADTAQMIADIQAMVDTLRGTDLSALQAMDGAIDAVNGLTRVHQKEVEMNAATGRYNYNLSLEGLPTFVAAEDYVAVANAINNPQCQVFIENKTKDALDLLVKSYGRHYVPQPVDGSTTPVKIAVSISHAPASALTNVVPVLQEDREGTDNVTVGADT